MKPRAAARLAGNGSLGLLAFIHLVLPFTPANPHPELHIKIGLVTGDARPFDGVEQSD